MLDECRGNCELNTLTYLSDVIILRAEYFPVGFQYTLILLSTADCVCGEGERAGSKLVKVFLKQSSAKSCRLSCKENIQYKVHIPLKGFNVIICFFI